MPKIAAWKIMMAYLRTSPARQSLRFLEKLGEVLSMDLLQLGSFHLSWKNLTDKNVSWTV